MDGGGKSQQKEFQAIRECIRSLKENRMMSVKNISGAGIRTTLYLLRKLLITSGGGKVLGMMKRMKYKRENKQKTF
jgi:hypothetical protein